MIALMKYLDLPWEIARGYLRTDLQQIESALNAAWSRVFNTDSTIKTLTILGTLIVPVKNGGTGTANLPSGLLIGNGTNPVTSLAFPGDVTKFLNGTGGFTIPGGTITAANIAARIMMHL